MKFGVGGKQKQKQFNKNETFLSHTVLLTGESKVVFLFSAHARSDLQYILPAEFVLCFVLCRNALDENNQLVVRHTSARAKAEGERERERGTCK